MIEKVPYKHYLCTVVSRPAPLPHEPRTVRQIHQKRTLHISLNGIISPRCSVSDGIFCTPRGNQKETTPSEQPLDLEAIRSLGIKIPQLFVVTTRMGRANASRALATERKTLLATACRAHHRVPHNRPASSCGTLHYLDYVVSALGSGAKTRCERQKGAMTGGLSAGGSMITSQRQHLTACCRLH